MPDDPLQGLTASLAQVRRALARIAEQRDVTERSYAAMVVSEAQLQRVLTEQRAYLDRSRAEIERAREVARRAADQARDDGLDASAYEQTIEALAAEIDVLEAARQQLAVADEARRENAARARALLHDNRSRLDASLREQLRLLDRLEQLDRDRGIAAARRRQSWQRGHQ